MFLPCRRTSFANFAASHDNPLARRIMVRWGHDREGFAHLSRFGADANPLARRIMVRWGHDREGFAHLSWFGADANPLARRIMVQ